MNLKFYHLRMVLLGLCLLGLFSQSSNAQNYAWPKNYDGVMLQGFYWDSFSDTKWTNLTSQADELSASFDLIWVPNSGDCQSQGMGYMPVWWFKHNGSFGSDSELRAMISAYRDRGVGIIEDVVVNHRNGKSNWTDFPAETYNGVTWKLGPEHICSTDEVRNQAGQAQPTGAPDSGDDFNGARDLDHKNSYVRDAIKAYLDYLKNDLGYIGWRYDMVKGYSASFTGEYNKSAKAAFSVGEYWDGYDNIVNWIEGTGKQSAAFDFPNKYAMNEAFGGGNYGSLMWKRGSLDQPAGLIHSDIYQPYAVTFVDNHDTYRDGNKMSGNIVAANAYMLCNPGTPCVFLPHWKSNKAEIKKFIAIRKAVGIHSQSAVKVLATAGDIYAAEVTGTKGKLVIKVGTRSQFDPAGYTSSDIVASGNGYCIWSKSDVSVPNVIFSPVPGVYQGGTTVTFTVQNAPIDADIMYTIDGSTPTKSNGIKVKNGATIKITQKTELKAIVIVNGIASAVMSGMYKTSVEQITVYIKQPTWSTMNFYAWQEGVSDAKELLGVWPGKEIIETEKIMNITWLKHTFSTDVQSFNIIFNNGTDQTIDITNINETKFYILQGEAGKTINVEDVTKVYTGVESISTDNIEVAIYPNPVSETLKIRTSGDVSQINIFSINGAMVAQSIGNDKEVDVSSLPQGIYTYTVIFENGSIARGKIIKK